MKHAFFSKILLIFVISCFVVSATNAIQPVLDFFKKEVVVADLGTAAQWEYVDKNLIKAIADNTSIVQKCGQLLKDHPVIITYIGMLVQTIIMTCVHHEDGNSLLDDWESFFNNNISVSSKLRYASDALILTVPGALIAYWLFSRLLGGWLGDNTKASASALEVFVRSWDKHQAYAPRCLHPVFTKLATMITEKGSLQQCMKSQEIKELCRGIMSIAVLMMVAQAHDMKLEQKNENSRLLAAIK